MAKPIISFVSLILSIGFTFLYVIPMYNHTQERRGDIESLSKILSTSSEIKTLITETKENLKGIDTSVLERFNVFLPERIDPVRFANTLQSIGRNNRIILEGIKVTTPPAGTIGKTGVTGGTGAVQGLVNIISLGAQIDKAQGAENQAAVAGSASPFGKYVATHATFSFVADFETFQLFLNDLERSLGLINLTSLTFSQVSGEASSISAREASTPTYQYTMEIETYSLQ